MDILSILPFILFILIAAAKINKGAPRTKQRPLRQYPQSFPWVQNLETSLQKWLLDEGQKKAPITEHQEELQFEETAMMADILETEGTSGVEGTPGIEGTAATEEAASTGKSSSSFLSSETKRQLSAKPSYPLEFDQNGLRNAVIWAEILGKPKARINRPSRGLITTK